MTIKVENFSEKKIINFYAPSLLVRGNGLVVKNKTCDVTDGLIGEIMQIDGVERCLICGDLVSVQYSHEPEDVRLFVLSALDDFLHLGGLLIEEKCSLSDLEAAEALADALIRPTLYRDKGNLEIISLHSGLLKVRFLGHCAGCPYAQNTLQNIVVKTFQRFMPQIQQVQMEENR